ncbi:MAG: adenylate/guanylate cyclase domain-containing protein [Stellaceae bacterium]
MVVSRVSEGGGATCVSAIAVDKITGDGILAVFGSPEPDAQRHEKAVRAALAMQAAMSEISEERRRRRQVTCTIGIKVHCGEVLHGFVGSKDRMELTIIGEAANWTDRYCSGAGGGEILLSPVECRSFKDSSADPLRIKLPISGKFEPAQG